MNGLVTLMNGRYSISSYYSSFFNEYLQRRWGIYAARGEVMISNILRTLTISVLKTKYNVNNVADLASCRLQNQSNGYKPLSFGCNLYRVQQTTLFSCAVLFYEFTFPK